MSAPDIIEEVSRVLQDIDESLKTEFDRNRRQFYNPNVKGQVYEKVLAAFLRKYLGTMFTIYERAKHLDYRFT